MKNIRLINVREKNELTQRQISSILKVSKSNYCRWENLEQLIPLERLNDFCNKFNTSMDFVFGLCNKEITYNKINNIDKKLVGRRLKEIRKENNISQIKLANILNTSHSTISAYETGKVLILTAFAYQICLKYNISLDWLCGRTSEKRLKLLT